MPAPAMQIINCPDCGSNMSGRYMANPPKVPKDIVFCASCGLMDLEENWITLQPVSLGSLIRKHIPKPDPICSICSSSPHKTSCGMYSPYPKG